MKNSKKIINFKFFKKFRTTLKSRKISNTIVYCNIVLKIEISEAIARLVSQLASYSEVRGSSPAVGTILPHLGIMQPKVLQPSGY